MQIKQQFILREILDEYVLVPTGKTAETFHGMASLNEVGARIWALLPGAADGEEIVQKLLEEYDVEERRLRQDVEEFLQHLCRENIID